LTVEDRPTLAAIFGTLVPSGALEGICNDLRSVPPLPGTPPGRVERGRATTAPAPMALARVLSSCHARVMTKRLRSGQVSLWASATSNVGEGSVRSDLALIRQV